MKNLFFESKLTTVTSITQDAHTIEPKVTDVTDVSVDNLSGR